MTNSKKSKSKRKQYWYRRNKKNKNDSSHKSTDTKEKKINYKYNDLPKKIKKGDIIYPKDMIVVSDAKRRRLYPHPMLVVEVYQETIAVVVLDGVHENNEHTIRNDKKMLSTNKLHFNPNDSKWSEIDSVVRCNEIHFLPKSNLKYVKIGTSGPTLLKDIARRQKHLPHVIENFRNIPRRKRTALREEIQKKKQELIKAKKLSKKEYDFFLIVTLFIPFSAFLLFNTF